MTQHQTQAEQEYHRVRHLAAFTLTAPAKRRNVNQHVREYTYPDGSILRLFRRGYATVVLGRGGFVIVIGTIRANAWGH